MRLYLIIPFIFFFFNHTATTEIYTLSLHDALPISRAAPGSSAARSATARAKVRRARGPGAARDPKPRPRRAPRSEEHTSELQSRRDLVCRLLLEKKKHNYSADHYATLIVITSCR